jgi:Spx/MgsR family transcriptional regulator
MITVYGLKNCDTCRKARKWLDAEDRPHHFRDIRAEPVDREKLQQWADAVGWEVLLNRRGTTWRGLPEAEKVGVDAEKAMVLMHQYPALLKRPVFEAEGTVIVGFKAADQVRLAALSGD